MSRPRQTEKKWAYNPFDFEMPFEVKGFMSSIEGLRVKPSEVTGDVFVIGHGPVFPERGLLFLPEGRYREQLRPEVRSLVTAEPEWPSSPAGIVFGLDTANRDIDPKPEIPSQNPRVIDYYSVGAGYILDSWPSSVQFDTVLMFRVPNLEHQLNDVGLLDSIARHLRPGGRFICSGSFETDRPTPHSALKVARTVQLSTASDGYPFSGFHLGVVYQRPPDQANR